MNLSNIIGRFLKKIQQRLFPTKQDKLWNGWLDWKKRTARDLKMLLSSNDVYDEYKVRALQVLLAPDLRKLSFRWDEKVTSPPSYLFPPWFQVKEFPKELLGTVAELVCINSEYASRQNDRQVRSTLFEYNEIILQLLEVFPEESTLAERLFSRYQINDPIVYTEKEDVSGYNPFSAILGNVNIPLKWKILADKKMRRRIFEELTNLKEPRASFEFALSCYTHHIQFLNLDGRESYSRELLGSQIDFIVNLPELQNYEKSLFNPSCVIHIMRALHVLGLKETLHKLARIVVLANKRSDATFSIENIETRRVADLILREFETVDTELVESLKKLIE